MTATHDAIEAGTLSFEAAVAMFLEYLKGYRSCAAVSVKAYRRDLRAFSEFLSQSLSALAHKFDDVFLKGSGSSCQGDRGGGELCP